MIEAGLATIARRRDSLRDTIASLLPQVDRLHVHCNDYEPDTSMRHPKIRFTSGVDLGDAGKFMGYENKPFATCDDDLIYPPDYITRLVGGWQRHPGAAVSFHGATMRPGWKRYFRDRSGYACLGAVNQDVKVHVIGTGVALIPGGFDKQAIFDAPRNMADIHIACQAMRFGVQTWVLAHPANWITHSAKVDLNDTIWATAVNNDLVHSRLLKRAMNERDSRLNQKPN